MLILTMCDVAAYFVVDICMPFSTSPYRKTQTLIWKVNSDADS